MSFAAYITSFLPLDNKELRDSRSAITRTQIQWWLENTEVDIFVTAMNYEPQDYLTTHNRLQYIVNPPMKLTPARRVGFEKFYSSDYDFGIMMDDDAILYNKAQHNSGAKFFAEMDQQISKYSTLDVFFPINPQKIGFNPIWRKNPSLYENSHVFVRNLDLKGSMFVVRNMRKFGKPEVLPDIDYNWQEDTKFAIDCIAAGLTVMQSHNIVLHELSGKASHFAATANLRAPRMLEGNEKIAKQYADKGLRMKKGSHLLDKRTFLKTNWCGASTKLTVPKPGSPVTEVID